MILFSRVICTGFGIGKIPFFPGTLASISILPIIWIIKKNISLDIFLLLIFLYSLVSYFLIKICIKNEINKDPSYIVVDEHIGQAIALIFCDENIYDYFLAFLMFRFFDIFKPFPISYFDKLKTPIGVIGDDILAGLFSGLIILLLQ